jgi:Cys-tRNA(Pro)/Cys-tRNA(Cys) deacylase
MSVKKTNAARLLDRQGIAYDLIPYRVDENDLGARHVAETLGEDIERVFKTILVHGNKTGHLVCVVPGNLEVDLKATARVSGDKKIDTVPLKDLMPLTGYVRGGCSPLGLKKNFPVFLHETALQFPFVYVSAGEGGLQLKLAPADLAKATRATVGCIARIPPEAPRT